MHRRPGILLLAFLVLVFPVRADAQEYRQIGWDDLLPAAEGPIMDPMAELPLHLAVKLEDLIYVLEEKEQGRLSEVSPEYESAVESRFSLEKAGVDVDRMIASVRNTKAEIERRNSLTVSALDGQFVKVPGYALPLEHRNTSVSEFLLVPYIGACIHVPPPPPNQMVFAQLSEPVKVKSIFAPVWVMGRISVRRTEKSVFITDGTTPVVSGYVIENAKVLPYED